MTDLWLHVNTFFIIVLIFFRYSSHIKKYMAAYFICLRKLSFYSACSFKFVLWFLKFSLPGTVKAAPAKLCAAFLCTLLNRLRFSPQNVGFGTKEYPGSVLALSGGAPLPSAPVGRSHLPQGDGFRGGGKLCGSTKRLPLGGAGALAPEGVLPRELPQSSRCARCQPPRRWGLWHSGTVPS